MARYIMVAAWPRVTTLAGLYFVAEVPGMTPVSRAQVTAPQYRLPLPTSLNG